MILFQKMSEVLLSEVWLSALVALHISCRNSSWGCICASVAMLTGTITLRKVILVDCQRHLVLIQNKNWKQYITIINYQEGFGSIRFGLVSSLQESVRFGSTTWRQVELAVVAKRSNDVKWLWFLFILIFKLWNWDDMGPNSRFRQF